MENDFSPQQRAMKVRVREHLYGHFRRHVREFRTNQVKYKGKYIPKCYDVDTYIGGFYRLKNMAGQFDATLFHALQLKAVDNMYEWMRQHVYQSNAEYALDKHSQGITYYFGKSDECIFEKSPIEVDLNMVNRVYIDASCFGSLGSKIVAADQGGSDYMAGWFTKKLELSPKRAQEWIDVCYEYGALNDDIMVWLEKGKVCFKCLISVTMDKRRLYYALNFPRMINEYHGAVNCTLDAMKEYGISLYLAMHLAFIHGKNTRALHLPYDPFDHQCNVEWVLPFAKSLAMFAERDMFEIDTGTNFSTATTINNVAKDVKLGLDREQVGGEELMHMKDKEVYNDFLLPG